MHLTIGAALVFQGRIPLTKALALIVEGLAEPFEATLIMLKVISLGALAEKGC